MTANDAADVRRNMGSENDRPASAAAELPAPLRDLVADSECVAFARFARDGSLKDANSRFLQVCGARVASADIALPDIALPDIVAVGQHDEMLRLLDGGAPVPERRNVHFGSGEAVPASLRVTWARDGDDLLMLGESPVSDAEGHHAPAGR